MLKLLFYLDLNLIKKQFISISSNARIKVAITDRKKKKKSNTIKTTKNLKNVFRCCVSCFIASYCAMVFFIT